MFALLCKPLAVPTPNGNISLHTKDCRIVKLAPTQVPNILELEILEAPPINISESD